MNKYELRKWKIILSIFFRYKWNHRVPLAYVKCQMIFIYFLLRFIAVVTFMFNTSSYTIEDRIIANC